MNPQSVPKDLYLFQAIGDGAPIIPGAEPMSLDYREGELQDAIFSFEVEQLSQRDSFTLAMMTPALDRPLEVKAKRSGGALIFFAKCEGDRDWQNWKRLRAMELRMLNVAHGRSGAEGVEKKPRDSPLVARGVIKKDIQTEGLF
ncbi:hypothetical protein quinque_011443 [Culex quinquefasciatus]